MCFYKCAKHDCCLLTCAQKIVSVQINEYNENILYQYQKKGCRMDLMTTSEMAKIWGISPRRVALLCSQGRVVGAMKKGKTWLIPSDAEKPHDPRGHKNEEVM